MTKTSSSRLWGATAFFALLLLPMSSAQAQNCYCDTSHWKLRSWVAANCTPYFVNTRYGFAFLDPEVTAQPNGVHHLPLYRTKDSGATWQLCDTNSYLGAIKGLCFESVAHGYAAVARVNYWFGNFGTSVGRGGGVYETWDTGFSWHQISPAGDCWAVKASGNFVFAVGYDSTGSEIHNFTTDGGISWHEPRVGNKMMSNYVLGGDILEELFDNGDGFIGALMSDRAVKNSQFIVATTDGGGSWAPYPPIPRLDNFGANIFCLPHRIAIFEQDRGLNAVMRCLDTLIRWDTALKVKDFPYQLQDEIRGDGCAVYVMATSGFASENIGDFARSTDLGKTWAAVSAPLFMDASTQHSYHFCVTGHGAVIYSIDGFGYVWRTTDGGDGALAHVGEYHTIALSHQLPASASEDTLVTKLCDTTNFSLAFQYSGSCSFGSLDDVRIDGLDTSEYRDTQTHHLATENKPDTVWVTISPNKSGVRPLLVHAIYMNDDKEELDTTFSLSLNVGHNPGVLDLAAKPLYDFGVQSLCKPHVVWDSFSVSGHGCEAVTVDSIVFMSVSGSGFTFKKVKSFIASNTQHLFRISYKPAAAESDSGVVVIYSFDGTSHHTDTLLARGSAVADSRSFVIASDTLTTRMCDSVAGTVTFQNPTCNKMEIDSILLPPGLTLLSKLPAMLDTSSTTTLNVRVSPGTGIAPLRVGDTALAIRLHVVGTSSFDTTVMLHVHISRGIPAMTLLTNNLNFDSVSTCSSKRLAVLIQSTGCDTLHCNGTVSKAAFLLERPFSSGLPVGYTDTAWVTFASQTPGLFFDTLTIATNAGKEVVPLQAYAMADVAALTGGSLALPQVIASCGGDTGQINLPNLSCKSIVIDSVAGICTPFQVLSGIGDTVLSSGSGRLIVSYIPHSPGSDDCTVRVYYHGADGIPHDTTYTFSASAITPPRLNVHLVQAGLSASNQRHVTIPVRLNASSGIAGPDTIAFRLNMRTDLLTPLSVASPIVGAHATTTQSDYSGVSVSVALPSGFAILADTVLATVDCKAFVTDTMQTTITLTQPSITSREQCLSLDSVSPVITFDLNPSCGDSLLTFYIGHQSFTIESIRPNPARDVIEVMVSTPGNLLAELYDVLGNATSPPLSTLNGTAFSIDVSNLRNGVYYLRLKQDGYSQSRRVVISR